MEMNLDQEIEVIQLYIDALQKVLKDIEDRLEKAKHAWPSHQILPAEWNDRSVMPPVGIIWATDGIRVWTINSDGTPISLHATAVKWWTTAYIPAPPSKVHSVKT